MQSFRHVGLKISFLSLAAFPISNLWRNAECPPVIVFRSSGLPVRVSNPGYESLLYKWFNGLNPVNQRASRESHSLVVGKLSGEIRCAMLLAQMQ